MSFTSFPWQVIIIAATLLSSIGQIFNKYQVNRAASLQVTIYKYLSSLVVAFGLWSYFKIGWPRQWLLLLLYGFSVGLSITLYTKAARLSLSKTVLSTPSSQVLAIVIAGFLFREWQLFNLATVNGLKMIGALSLIPMLMYLFYERGEKTQKWSFLIISLMIYLAIIKVFAKFFLDQVEPLQMLLLQYIGAVAVVSVGLKLKKRQFWVSKNFALTGLTQGLFTSTGVWLYYVGLQKATVTQTVLLRMPIFILLTTVVGLYGFKEIKTMTLKKWLGMGVALVIVGLVITANY